MANKVHIVLLLIVFPILLITNLSFPQYDDIKFEHFTSEDGLPHMNVTSVLQDYLGFLWFGTQNGLVKYDGYLMKVYRPEKGDSTSLSLADVTVIYEDKNRNLWIGTGLTNKGGLNRYNRVIESFTRYVHNPNDTTSLNSNYIKCIYEDKAGRLWVGTDKGLNYLDKKKNKFQHYYFQDSSKLKEGLVFSIGENQLTGDVLVGCEFSGLWKCNLDKKVISKINFVDNAEFLNTCAVLDFEKSNNEYFWMGTNKGLAKLNLENEQLKFYQIVPTTKYIQGNENDFTSILKDNNELIWIGTPGKGLALFNPAIEKFNRYQYDRFDPSSLYGFVINSLYEDHSGIIWVGKYYYGIDKYDRKKWKFKHYSNNPRSPNSLSAYFVSTIIEDSKGMLWIGTLEGGLNLFDRQKNKFTHYRHNPSNPYSLSHDNIRYVIEDTLEKDILWIGTWDGLNKFDQAKGIFLHYRNDPADPTSISHNHVSCAIIDHNGDLWFSTWGGGVNRFDRRTKKFIRFQNDPDDQNSLSHDLVSLIYEDRSGTLWIGTELAGLNRLNRKTGKFIQYKSLLEDQGSSSIVTMYEDNQGNFWLGTYKSGIHLFDRSKGISIKNFTEEDGLSSNSISAILEDDSGNLWISTFNGITKFNYSSKSFKKYGISDGLEGMILNEHSAFKNSRGEMFFGGEYGINIFHPDSIKDDPVPPKVVIENVSLFNRPGEKLIFEKFISELDEIKLKFDQNDLRFDFVGLHFSEPTKNIYKYMLEGFDEDWVDAGTQRNAVYTNLDPGEYIFKVTAANRDGVWNEEGASIKLIISPPFWATTWAKVIYALVVLSIIYFTWKLQLKRIQIKHDYEMSKFEAEKMHEVDEMKSRFFANISHEFRTPLTLILGLAKKIVDKTKETDSREDAGVIKRNANRLHGLVNQLLDLSKLESGNMVLQTSPLNIIPLLKGLALSFISFSERKRITLKFNSNEEEIVAYIDKDKIEKIVTNLLSNALKFTPEGGNVEVSIKTTTPISPLTKGGIQGGLLEIAVSDTGIGISLDRIKKIFDRFYQVDSSHTREQEGTGLGLALTKELVELHKGQIRVESSEGKGSTFTVTLPLGKDHLKPEEIIESKSEREKKTVLEEFDFGYKYEVNKVKSSIDKISEEEKLLLLIVEDNADVRNYIKGNFKEEFRTLEAVDGKDGLNQSISHIPDLIISDVMMPKMDGFEMCDKLKNDERTSHIPVIMLTAKATDKDKIDGYKTGADDYIMKPFDTEVLRARINNLIQQRDRLREHFKKEGIIRIDDTNVTPTDKIFLKKALDIINKHLSDDSFSVDIFADEIAMSRSQLGRKLVALVGESPGDLIRRIRLTKAAKLIEENFGNISEIAAEVGFNNPSNFARSFKTQFGVSPSDYLSSKK